MPDRQSWRDRYVELLREGEALNLSYDRLGGYIATRLDPTDLRAMLREHYTAHDRKNPQGGTPQ